MPRQHQVVSCLKRNTVFCVGNAPTTSSPRACNASLPGIVLEPAVLSGRLRTGPWFSAPQDPAPGLRGLVGHPWRSAGPRSSPRPRSILIGERPQRGRMPGPSSGGALGEGNQPDVEITQESGVYSRRALPQHPDAKMHHRPRFRPNWPQIVPSKRFTLGMPSLDRPFRGPIKPV